MTPCSLPPLPTGAPIKAVVVLCVSKGRVLTLRRGRTAPWAAGMWSLPGGKIDPGEAPLTAALRELREETDLVAVDAKPMGAPYDASPPGGHTFGVQAVICGCESEEPIGKSSTFEGGLPVSEELGFPENDAWAFITASQIPDYPQPAAGNPLLLAEALRRKGMSVKPATGIAARKALLTRQLKTALLNVEQLLLSIICCMWWLCEVMVVQLGHGQDSY